MKKVNRLIQECSRMCGKDIRGKSRLRKTVYARAVFYTIVKSLHPKLSLTAIGNSVNRDHATVLYGLRNAKDTYMKDVMYQAMYTEVISKVNANPDKFDVMQHTMIEIDPKTYKLINELKSNLKRTLRENDKLKNQMKNKRLLNAISEMPEEKIDDFIDTRLIPYTKMIKTTKYEN